MQIESNSVFKSPMRFRAGVGVLKASSGRTWWVIERMFGTALMDGPASSSGGSSMADRKMETHKKDPNKQKGSKYYIKMDGLVHISENVSDTQDCQL